MKPYMIDSYMREGETVRKFEPQVLNPSICKKSTADSLTRALLKVTGEMGGTGYWAFRGAKCPVAGKGLSQVRRYRRFGAGPVPSPWRCLGL